jgi:CDK inhibitor PHO81
MEELLSKRRAAAMRGLPDIAGDTTQNNVEWSAVEEGFRLLERDLGKLQVAILQGLFYPFSQIAAIRRN